MDSDQPISLNDLQIAEALTTPAVEPIPYASGHLRAMTVLTLLGFGAILSLALCLSYFRQYQLMGVVASGRAADLREIEANSNRMAIFGSIEPLWYFATVVAFLTWIHRAHRNLPSMGATELEFTPRWAVGWYFIPFGNLFKPYEVMREIYNSSSPKLPPEHGWDQRRHTAPLAVKAWWGLFLLMNLLHGVAINMLDDVDDPVALQVVDVLLISAEAVVIVASAAAACLVWSVDKLQARRAFELGLS